MRKIVFGLLTFATAMTAGAETREIVSPDGGLKVCVSDDGGKASYTVSLNGVTCIETSPLGLVLNFADYTSGLKMARGEAQKTVDVDYTLRNIKRSHVSHKASEMTIPFTKDGKPVFDLLMHVSDNDVAFKYRIHPQGETQVAVVKEEKTGFTLPEGTTTFLCPQSAPMQGFARTSPSYETNYTLDDNMGKNGWGNGYSFPCLFKVQPPQAPRGGMSNAAWVLISETGVDGSYCAGRLLCAANSPLGGTGGAGASYSIGQPQPGEMNGAGSTSPAIALPGCTPWRTITVGSSLAPIVETTIPFDVVKPKYAAKQEAQYGRGSWSWIIGMDPSCNFNEQKRYIDFSAAMGYESVLIDALWDTQIGREKIAELARYGKSKGVALYLWYNSNGTWNDAPQGPRHLMDKSQARRAEMAWMKSIGIRGIKVDFFGGDKQETMRLYEDILSDAADYGIDVIFHGCTMPRGWERMYPNYVGSEAVLASENLIFGQQFCDLEAFSACLHPFIRNSVGIMEFGGTFLNRRMSRDNSSGNVRRTGDAFELATAVLFQNPVQNFALAPNNLEDAPAEAIGFMKDVPVVWDDVRFIGGYPGKSVVLARRSGDLWYVAGINAEETDLAVVFDPSLIGADAEDADARLYVDDSVESMRVCTPGLRARRRRDPRTLSLTLPQNCGFVLVMKAAGAAD